VLASFLPLGLNVTPITPTLDDYLAGADELAPLGFPLGSA
jgi:hypothetical protein